MFLKIALKQALVNIFQRKKILIFINIRGGSGDLSKIWNFENNNKNMTTFRGKF